MIEGSSLEETNKNLDEIVALAKQLQQETGIKLLWGTANLFSHPVKYVLANMEFNYVLQRYMNGAATNPDLHVFAYAAAQVTNHTTAKSLIDWSKIGWLLLTCFFCTLISFSMEYMNSTNWFTVWLTFVDLLCSPLSFSMHSMNENQQFIYRLI